ncbi:MAG: hypothetical protein KAI22_05125, partial [Gammaproteobacteria bacterium]|nr:hypothetical protein [Gammaproteobacteria bacterium]
MNLVIKVAFITIASTGVINLAMAELMIFPAQGQSDEQTEKDKFSCYGWAKQQTGFDPMALPTTSTPAPSQQQKSGGVARGALGGAALGAIVGDSSRSARNAG